MKAAENFGISSQHLEEKEAESFDKNCILCHEHEEKEPLEFLCYVK